MTNPVEREAISGRVRNLIFLHLDVELAEITDTARFIDDLGADSLDWMELIMSAEEEFDIEITDDEAEKVQTVGDAIKLIQGKLA